MQYRELQEMLRDTHSSGRTSIKLNRPKVELEAEYNRLVAENEAFADGLLTNEHQKLISEYDVAISECSLTISECEIALCKIEDAQRTSPTVPQQTDEEIRPPNIVDRQVKAGAICSDPQRRSRGLTNKVIFGPH